jgi:hypothetical protein
MDHEVKYPDGSRGTRTHDGFTFRNDRRPEDEDIVEILKPGQLSALGRLKGFCGKPCKSGWKMLE